MQKKLSMQLKREIYIYPFDNQKSLQFYYSRVARLHLVAKDSIMQREREKEDRGKSERSLKFGESKISSSIFHGYQFRRLESLHRPVRFRSKESRGGRKRGVEPLQRAAPPPKRRFERRKILKRLFLRGDWK